MFLLVLEEKTISRRFYWCHPQYRGQNILLQCQGCRFELLAVCFSNLAEQTRVRKLIVSAFKCCTGCPKHFLTVRVPICYLNLFSRALLKDLFPSTNRDHGRGSGSLGQNSFHFRQLSFFWNPQDPLRRFHKAAPDLQVILAVCKATSDAALTDVADHEAGPEVD